MSPQHPYSPGRPSCNRQGITSPMYDILSPARHQARSFTLPGHRPILRGLSTRTPVPESISARILPLRGEHSIYHGSYDCGLLPIWHFSIISLVSQDILHKHGYPKITPDYPHTDLQSPPIIRSFPYNKKLRSIIKI